MFDARAAKALKAGDHLTVPQAPGLRLKATQTLKTWVYRFRSPEDGKLRQVRIGHWPALGLPQAIAAWEKLRAERVSGVDPAARKRAAKKEAEAIRAAKSFTVRRVCDDFLADYQGRVAEKTYRWADQLLGDEVLGDLAERPAAEVTRREAFAALERVADRPVAAAKLRQLLGQAWDLALDAGRLEEETPNWWRQLMRGKLVSKGKIVKGEHQGQAIKRVLSEAELRLLLPWLPNFTRDIDDALRLYLWTGCRGAEIVGMRRSEITEEADGLWWTIPKERRKTRKHSETTDLRVPLIGQAEAVVRRRVDAADADVLWPSRGALGHVHQKALGVAVWTHMPDCELRPEWSRPRLPVVNWAPHDLRRTARTLLAALGCQDEIAEAILGHKIEGVKGVYNRHRYDRERREWLTLLAAHLDGLCGPAPAPGR
jgi:integrase